MMRSFLQWLFTPSFIKNSFQGKKIKIKLKRIKKNKTSPCTYKSAVNRNPCNCNKQQQQQQQ